jgi:hypothetical protein
MWTLAACAFVAGVVSVPIRILQPKPEVKEKIVVIMYDRVTGRKEMYLYKDGCKYKLERIEKKPSGVVPQGKYTRGHRGCA